MPYTTVRNEISFSFVDERDDRRRRVIELAPAYVFVEDDAILMSAVSKSAVRSFRNTNKQVDLAQNFDVGSEVKDTLRLWFLLDDDTKAHFDVVDPKDELFLDTTGEGANIMRSVAQLLLVGGAPGIAMDALITKIMLGDILISDGEQPIQFLEGKRI